MGTDSVTSKELSLICINCKKLFRKKPKGPRQPKFCSVRCRMAHHRWTHRELSRHDWHSPAEIVWAARIVMGA